MSARSERRERERRMRAAGVAAVARQAIPADKLARHTPDFQADILCLAIGDALTKLARQGADMTGPLAITVGDNHPDYPGLPIVEAKAGRMRQSAHRPGDCSDPRCPLDHTLDGLDG